MLPHPLRPEVWIGQDSARPQKSVRTEVGCGGFCPCSQIPMLYPPPSCSQATVLCDLLLLHILPKRHYYKQKKFKYAEDMRPEAVRELPELGPSERSSSVSVMGS